MAKYLKVNAGPVAGDGIDTLIAIDQIAGITSVTNAANVTTITIQMVNPKTTGTYVIAVPGVTGAASQNTTSAIREKDATDAINDALTANPGGVVSTLGAVPALFQVPAAQGPGGSDGKGPGGRTVVTTAATFAQYTTCIYTP